MRGAAYGAFQNMDDEAAEQHLVAHAQGVKITFHLGIGGIPFCEGPAGDLAGLISPLE